MSKHLERDLEVLERELLALSSIVEEMIAKACRALRSRDIDLAQSVINQDEVVNRREVMIEDECLKILALHQPVAVNLRRIAAIMKINNDLERIADLAVNTSATAVNLAKYANCDVPVLLTTMATIATEMVRQTLDAFVDLDVDKANAVRARDDEIDELNRTLIDEMTVAMKSNSEQVEPGLECLAASRFIERVADHATNMAEDVIYLIQGEIWRHQKEPLVKSE